MNSILSILVCLTTILVSNVCAWPDFYVFTSANPDEPYHVQSNNPLSNSNFDPNKETKLIIHGYKDSFKNPKLNLIREGHLKKEDVNVIMVDWEEGAKMTPNILTAFNYETARKNCLINGIKVAEFLEENSINASKVHCIGHSLGAHSCGFAGKSMKLKRISGLDPACPHFDKKNKVNRLDQSDADWVDVIHTSAAFGIQEPIGHINFYPNGGHLQAGCIPNKNRILGLTCSADFHENEDAVWYRCSHSRAYEYYAESLTSNIGFLSTRCDTYDNYEKGNCKSSSSSDIAWMGYPADKKKLHGSFYLNTNKQSPFCQAP